MIVNIWIQKQKIVLAGIFVFLISFLVYILSLAPSIVFGDSADLIIAGYFWGVAHPTGFPLFTVLSKIFSFLPLGNIAFRFNLFSALFASLAVTVIYWTILTLTPNTDKEINRILPAVTGSLLFAFSYTFWSQSIITEFLSMEIFLISALILISLKWMESPRDRYIYSLSFLFALAVTHRSTTLFLALAFLYAVATARKRILLNPKKMAILLFAFLLGLSPYLYLPFSASRHPLRSWGDVTNVLNLWNHITGLEYRGHLFFFPSATIVDQLRAYYPLLLRQFTPALLGLALFGIYLLAKNRLSSLIFLTSLFFLNFAYAVNVYQISEPLFYGVGFLIIALWMGAGINLLLHSASKTSPFVSASVAVIVAFLPVLLIGNNFELLRGKHDYFAYDYAQNIFSSLAKNAILIFDGDNIFPLEYLQFVEKKRPDVAMIQKRSLQKNWYVKQLKRAYPSLIISKKRGSLDQALKNIITENWRRPVYTNTIIPEIVPFSKHRYRGMVFRIEPGKEGIVVDKTEFSYSYRVSLAEMKEPDYFSLLALKQPELNLLTVYLARGEPQKALPLAKKLLKQYPNSALFYFELAETYRALGQRKKALSLLRESVKRDPLFGDAYHAMAAAYLQEKDYVSALEPLEKSVIYQPKNPAFRYYLAQIYERVGLRNRAIKNWEILLSLDANYRAKKEAREHLRRLKGE